MAAAPESDSGPPLPRFGPGGGARLSYAFALDDFASLCLRPGRRPGRWRAGGAPLKPYRKLSQHWWALVVLSRLMLYTWAPLDA
jgi:hypothetical protein